MRSETQIKADNELMGRLWDDANDKMKAAFDWLCGAFHTHKSQLAHLLEEKRELAALLLAAVERPLTVREAQLTNACRVCRKPYSAPFVLDYGKEFAHEECLK